MIDEQDAILATAAPVQAKCDAAIEEANKRLIVAKDAQMTDAKAYEAASKEKTDCETASKTAEKAVRDNTLLRKRIEQAVVNAEEKVELFQQGPLAVFQDLQARAIPPVVVEAAAAPMEQAASTETI